MMGISCLALFLMCSSDLVAGHSAASRSSASPNQKVLPPISIVVVASPDIKESLVDRVVDEVVAIWGPTGIRFDWCRITSNDVALTRRITVIIDDQLKDSAEWQGALGWIPFTTSGPAASIHLSRASAEALILRTPGVRDTTRVGHEILVGRALGRALSHELGHYLLKSKVHTAHGLMRAIWRSDELLGVERRGFELTTEQRAAADEFPARRAG
jgi:hypothetical protein